MKKFFYKKSSSSHSHSVLCQYIHKCSVLQRQVAGAVITQQPNFTNMDNTPHYEQSKSRIQFSVYYDMQQSSLAVHVISTTNLSARGRRKWADLNPFVTLFLIPSREQTFSSSVRKKHRES